MAKIGPFVGKTALIFDLDGTLVETDTIHCSAFQKTFLQYGIRSFDYARFGGQKTEEVVSHVFSKAGISADESIVRQATEQKQQEARKAIATTLSPVPGSLEFLRCAARAGFRLAIATGASGRGAALSMKAVKIESFFEIIVTGDHVTRGKPAPDIFLKAVELLEVQRDECLVFEDSLSGHFAACAAGIDTLILQSARHNFPDDFEGITVFDYQDLSTQIDRNARP